MFNYSLNFNLIAIISDTFWKIKQLTLNRIFHFFRVRLRKKLFGAHCFITFFSLYVSECKIYTTILLRKKQGAFHDAPCFCFKSYTALLSSTIKLIAFFIFKSSFSTSEF